MEDETVDAIKEASKRDGVAWCFHWKQIMMEQPGKSMQKTIFNEKIELRKLLTCVNWNKLTFQTSFAIWENNFVYAQNSIVTQKSVFYKKKKKFIRNQKPSKIPQKTKALHVLYFFIKKI